MAYDNETWKGRVERVKRAEPCQEISMHAACLPWGAIQWLLKPLGSKRLLAVAINRSMDTNRGLSRRRRVILHAIILVGCKLQWRINACTH